ncbi:MAG: right-handed parallel beta-helix repeat-containing protein [Verrucomicrobiota bacterium]
MKLRGWGLCLTLAAGTLCRAADFYVAPDGRDSNHGTEQQPFATLPRARDAVRERKAREPNRNYEVVLRGGLYRVHETVVFSLPDSAAEGHTIAYVAYPGEKPVFTTTRALTEWKQEQDGAGGARWTTMLPAGMKPFLTLYDGAGRLPRARGAAFSPARDYKAIEQGLDKFTLPFPEGKLENWPDLADGEIAIRPNYGWVFDILPLESVDTTTRMARTRVPASYPMVRIRWGLRDVNAKGTVWVENVAAVLDEPGEWTLNTTTRTVTLIARDGQRPAAIEAPQLTEMIRVEGEVDYEGPVDRPVRGLVFRGLTFTGGDRWPWERNRIGSTLQHDWEMFDRPTALVRLRGAERIAFEACHWRQTSGAGIRLDLHAQDNRIVESTLEHLGGAGIVLAGYGPGTKDVSKRNEILRNHVHHVGELHWHAAAIGVWQSGENRVANNLIHDTNYTAITVSGRINWNREGRGDGWATIRWKEIEAVDPKLLPEPGKPRPTWEQRAPFLHGRNNLVERNEIYGVMQKLWDGDAIYVSGTGGGNRVRENFIRDCVSENMCEAIRCDDDQHETTIERNVILRNGGMGTGIAVKGRNYVRNNFVVDPTGFFQPRGVISLEGVPVDGAVIERNVVVVTKPGLKPFFLKNLLGVPPDPKYSETKTDWNLYWHPTEPTWADAHFAAARAEGQEKNARFADPRFVDPEAGDFRFLPDSPAPAMGIEPVDLRRVGLRK